MLKLEMNKYEKLNFSYVTEEFHKNENISASENWEDEYFSCFDIINCNWTLDYILELHLNNLPYNYKDFNSRNSLYSCVKESSILIKRILLFEIEEITENYFHQAYLSMNMKYKKDFEKLKIKFSNTLTHASFLEVVDMLQNKFLNILNKELKFNFITDIIFSFNSEFLQSRSSLDNQEINYNFLVYYMNQNLSKITIKILKKSLTYDLTTTLVINPEFENKTDVIKKVNSIYKMHKIKIKINNSKNIDNYTRMKRLFLIHIFIKYKKRNYKNIDIYKEALRLEVGYSYQDICTPYDASENYSADVSPYIKQIKNDLNLIKLIENVID